ILPGETSATRSRSCTRRCTAMLPSPDSDSPSGPGSTVSVVIPARNEAHSIGNVLAAVRSQQPIGINLDIVLVDDGSTDDTVAVARAAGARVLELGAAGGGNPAIARNRGALTAQGDPIVFLDADCSPAPGWLDRLL